MPTPDELLKEKLGGINAGRVLDVATGHGEFVELLAQFLAGYDEIVGVDICPKCLVGARAHVKRERVSFVEMDGAKLTYRDHAFDTVAISNSLHHLADMPRVLQEMQRVLKPGGWFIIQEMFRDNQTAPQMSHVLFHHWFAEIDRLRGDIHNPTMTRAEILELIRDLHLADMGVCDLFYAQEISSDDEARAWFDQQIDKSLEKTSALPNAARLRQQGEEVREHIHRYGFASSDRVFAVGRKPA